MKNFSRLASRVFVFSALAAAGVQAQALRCDLIQTNNSCLDVDSLSRITPQPIVVPSNVTRLENNGLRLCQRTSTTGGQADIVYVYDNSGSMGRAYAWVSPGNVDTIFYQSYAGCPNPVGNPAGPPAANLNGTITIPVWNATGTATTPTTVPRIISNTGCTSWSGDPYNVRGAAFRQGLTNQQTRAPQSFAGIMSFQTTVGNSRRPLILNPANLATLQGSINSVANGGTIYRIPLDSSKNWLRNAAITSQAAGRSKAIIFLSDGRPTDTTGTPAAGNTTNYLSTLINNYRSPPLPTAAMPPIYGIFLGKDTVGTGRLRSLSLSTGGQFFLIPPNRPDSLIAVVNNILNIILVQYDPLAMTVTNTSLVPAQTSTATLVQDTVGGLHWNVTLDSVIALRSAATNAISVVSSYVRKRAGFPDSNITFPAVNFTLSTTGAAATGTATTTIPNTGTMFATHCYPPSRIQWLTIASARPPFFTENDSLNVRLRLRSSASDSDDASFPSTALTRRPVSDSERTVLPRVSSNVDSTVFTLAPVLIMRPSAANVRGNLAVEPFYSDSLIARWLHPRDNRDSARDTIPVRPVDRTSQIWFADPSNLTVAVSSFNPLTLDTVCVVVQDQRPVASQIYRATITDTTQGLDQETRLLGTATEITPGIFRSSFCIDARMNATKLANDGIVQFSPLGDQLRVVYHDPLYASDSSVANAGVGISVEETPSIAFTNAAFAPLVGNTAATPALLSQSPIYFRYQDDVGVPPVGNKPIILAVRSLRSGVSISTDRDSLAMSTTVTISASRKEWRGSISLAEALAPLINNGVLQGAYLVEITATVQSHSNVGAATGPVTAVMYAANPDSLPTLTITESVNTAKVDTVNATGIGGPVDVLLTLRDQDFVANAADTVRVTALCPASGDSVAGIRLRQTTPGVYATGDTVVRNNPTGNTTDRILGCPAGSPFTIRYVDAVYGTTTSWVINETATPTFTPSSAYPAPYYFISQVSVAIASATAGASLNYTQNGTMPRPGQPLSYSAPILLIAPDTIRAVAMGTGSLTVRSRVANSAYLYDPNRPASIIRILDAGGNPLPVHPLTGRRTVLDTATTLRLQVTTPQGGLGTVIPTIRSRLGDVENPPLGSASFIDPIHQYWDHVTLLAGAVSYASGDTDGNARFILSTRLPDTLIATWTNPLNPNDVAADTVIVWPNYAPSTVCFSASAGGPCVVAPFPNSSGPTTTTLYVRVTARADLPGAYSARVSTGPGGGADVENFALTQTAPGSGIYFSAAITMNENTPKTSANVNLQAYELGDTLRALFVHPIYRDSANGSALYGPPTEQAAALIFLDPSNNPLGNNSTYYFNGAGNDNIRVQYTDDWSSAISTLVNSKTLIMVLDVFRNGVRVARDTESVTLTYNVGAGVWLGTYPLRERLPSGLNLTVESAFRGVLTASVQSHTNLGGTASQPLLTQGMIILAQPNATAALTFTEHVSTVNPEGPVDILLTLTDQDFVGTAIDTATVIASCPTSGDSVVLLLRETTPTSGIYTVNASGGDTLYRNNPPINLTDDSLSCASGQSLSIRYTDPVYGTASQWPIAETAMPTATPASGTIFVSQQSVTLATTTAGAGINFDTLGVLPTPGPSGIYSIPIALIKSDTIKAVAMGPGGTGAGYVRSRVMTATYTRQPQPSGIVILDSNGNALLPNPLAGGRRAVTDAATSLRVQVTTSQGGLGVNTATNLTSRLGDVVTHPVDSALYNGQIITFRRNIQLLAGTGVTAVSNGIWEARLPDTLIATWTNPRNPADVVRDTIIVLPTYQASTACFTATQGGPCVNSFSNASPNPLIIDSFLVFIRVDARPNLPGVYSARVTTTDALDTLGNVSIPLTQTAPGSGIYVSSAIGLRATEFPRNTGNPQIEVANGGDQFEVRFVHPQYLDVSNGVAGYGRPPEVPATLAFLGPTGVQLANGSTYFLSGAGNDSVRVRYTDDWSAPIASLVNSKPLTLVLDIRRNGASVDRDSESVVMTYNLALNAWFGAYPLRELITSTDLNGTLETRFRGELVASVRPHDSLGLPTGAPITQNLIIVRVDSTVTLTFAEHVNTLNPEGPVDVLITLRDQSYVGNAIDTAFVTAVCPGVDSLVLRLRETSVSSGIYTHASGDTLFRNDPPASVSDRLLSCPAGGIITLRYTDPVFGGAASSWTVEETEMPVTAPASGTPFFSQQSVSLSSATSAAAINYTQNGVLPQPGQPVLYAVAIQLLASDTIKAVAMGPGGTGAGYVRSRVMTASYAWTPLPSSLEILDAGGNSVSTVNDLATSLQIRVTTSQGGLTSPTPAAVHSQVLGDDETDSLAFVQYNGQANVYQGSIALLGGATVANDANLTLQTRLPDTVIATWINPANANDVVRDTVIVLPAPFPTAVCFSATSGGACVAQLPNGTDTVYVRVASRPGLPGTYAVNVSSGPAGGSDSLGPLALAELAPGSGIYYSGPIVLNENTPKASNNGTVQVYSVGDVLTATFVHPQYQTTTTGTVNYQAPAQVNPTLVFLDPAGAQLPALNAFYYLPSDSIRVRYTDDWSTGIDALVRTKTLLLELDILQGGVRIDGDTETVTLTYNPAQNAWLGTYGLRDRIRVLGNDTVDTRFRGELTATVQSHSNAGATAGQPTIQRDLILAYQNQDPTVIISNAVGGGPVGRLTTSVSVAVTDQIYTVVPGTNQTTVRVSCVGTNDFEDVRLSGDGAGNYTLTPPLTKSEVTASQLPGAAVSNDGVLVCLISDQITAVHTDPVYNIQTPATPQSWTTPPAVVLYYALTTDPGRSSILQVSDNTDSNFLAVVVTPSPSLTLRDSVQVRLRSTQGEIEIFWARETGIATDTFLVSVPFLFSLSSPVSGNNRLDPQLNSGAPSTSVRVTGTAILVSGDTAVPAAITLNSQFNPPSGPGYVRDRNGDGIVETVYLPFSRPVTRMPVSIDTIYWNSDGANRRVGSQFSLSADSLTLIVTLNGSGLGASFPPFLTGASTPTPVAVLPPTPYFGGVRVNLNDSAGPVPQTASKRPSNAAAEPDPANSQILRLKPDTLVITVSEPIMTQSNWFNVFTFTKTSNCQDTTAVRFAITTVSEPVPDPTSGSPSTGYTRFTLYANYGLVSGQNQNCIFLQANRIAGGPGPFSDARANAPGRLGIPLSGSDAPPVIPYAGGYPPLWLPGNPIGNGMITGNPNINVNAGGYIEYLPPVCPRTQVNCRDSANGRTQLIVRLPDSISAVKVITSSAYTADIRLYDHIGNFVKTWVQDFGHSGEMENPNRVDPSGQGYRSFLEWDKRDEKGQRAGTGVYIWKVNFVFDTGRREVRLIRTGLVRTGL